MGQFSMFGKKSTVPVEDKAVWLRRCLVQNESNLIRYVKSLISDLETSKDIVQDSFLKLWQQDYESVRGKETPWLFKTSRNKAYDYLRSKFRSHLSSDEIALDIADEGPNAEQQLTQQNDTEILEQLLKKLTPQQRDIVHMKFEQDLSYKEISTVTGLSVNHVGVLIHNVVTRLKENMAAAEKGGRREAK